MQVCGRFAPSPSGRMHLGNAASALAAWLSARSQGGKMVFRIEDIDTARCRPEYARQLADDLRWLGLDWDEGGDVPGYRQSGRAAVYEDALARIARQAKVYPCWCTRAELHAASAPHASDGTPLYSGRCRGLSDEERAARAGRPAALRVEVPDETITWTDGHYGPQKENLARECGDFVLRRSDGLWAYQLAVTADDAAMGVTEVVRGRDLLGSTARQIWLHRLLGHEPPRYCHLPLLTAPDGRRLSKRERDLDLGALRARYSAPELVGRIAAMLGIGDGSPAEPRDLIPLFSWDKIPRQDIVVPPGLM